MRNTIYSQIIYGAVMFIFSIDYYLENLFHNILKAVENLISDQN